MLDCRISSNIGSVEARSALGGREQVVRGAHGAARPGALAAAQHSAAVGGAAATARLASHIHTTRRS